MNKNDLIKEPNVIETKLLMKKYSVDVDDFNVYNVDTELFIEWFKYNKSRNTQGGKVSSYSIGEVLEIFNDELKYCKDFV